MKKSMILVGTQGSGKTTLIQRLSNDEMVYRKTQAVEYHPKIIDTPGEYLENPRYYHAIVTLSFDAKIVAFVHDSTSRDNYFPPQFASMFNQSVVGIITKTDHSEADVVRSEGWLRKAGVTTVYQVSAYSGAGIGQVAEIL
ncbi:EutP/PduV family microcompartment system protein [Tindallia californiensis]|uniref:Ethanolamine utilization protein EutP n=1 Tax=Tindallia californiensis TaxID=159292 RepID=A0A1H3LT58_9FIRM|nr:EutP/PduV family microcompartment system protein [Tindallia californiensis]SDY67526.1 ethanolamine utilization protein EutP [Tindallia californiensis]